LPVERFAEFVAPAVLARRRVPAAFVFSERVPLSMRVPRPPREPLDVRERRGDAAADGEEAERAVADQRSWEVEREAHAYGLRWRRIAEGDASATHRRRPRVDERIAAEDEHVVDETAADGVRGPPADPNGVALVDPALDSPVQRARLDSHDMPAVPQHPVLQRPRRPG